MILYFDGVSVKASPSDSLYLQTTDHLTEVVDEEEVIQHEDSLRDSVVSRTPLDKINWHFEPEDKVNASLLY